MAKYVDDLPVIGVLAKLAPCPIRNWVGLAGCFAAGVPVEVIGGVKRIEEVLGYEDVGEKCDWVWARDEHNPDGPVVLKRVLRTVRRLSMIWELVVGEVVIRTTAEHPFWVVDKGWLGVDAMVEGDRLVGLDGQEVVVSRVRETDEITEVYNFEVEDAHTYFVGCPEWGFSVWTHNAGCGPAHNASAFAKYKKILEAKQNGGPYKHLPDTGVTVTVGGRITDAQKRVLLAENRAANNGVVRSDISGTLLTKPGKSNRGVTPDSNEWQFDHIIPVNEGGTNSYKNIMILSRIENRLKSAM